jgi:hypothetical protein
MSDLSPQSDAKRISIKPHRTTGARENSDGDDPQTRIDLPPIRRWSDDAYDVLADGASSAAS